tara:strand:- start:31 stop:306 length:276 start_codon:yes stop_codon:yes gene_type:complete
MNGWIDIEKEIPLDNQRVLAFIPDNKVFLPGMQLEYAMREVVILHFRKNFFADNEEKRKKHGLHFWSGEGNSNHFYHDVTHWKTIPAGPIA